MEMQDVLQILADSAQIGVELSNYIVNGAEENKIQSTSAALAKKIILLKSNIDHAVIAPYETFIDKLLHLLGNYLNAEFFHSDLNTLRYSLDCVLGSIQEMADICLDNIRKCSCCGNEVFYRLLPKHYWKTKEKHHSIFAVEETLNAEQYWCPVCGSSGRDRMVAAFFQHVGLQQAEEGTKFLHVAPSKGIQMWIQTHCPQIEVDTTDLYMEDVTFNSDIQDMYMVADETYDVILCSHVLEQVRDDRQALQEMRRILKPDGILVFLAPVALNLDEMDQKCGYYVHQLGKEYFGAELFHQASLVDTSTLYVLAKDSSVKLDRSYEYKMQTNGPLVSVILPCYNHESFVAESIESVLSQTYQNIEFIVADDASTDNTANVVRQYSEHFAKEFYFTEKPEAVGRFLRKQATGKYIAMMHSDDLWERDKLAIQVAYMESHEEVTACFTWCKYVDAELHEIPDRTFMQKNRNRYEWMNRFWNKGNCLCHPSILIRREEYIRLNDVGMSLRQLPDFYSWINLIQHADIYIVPKVLVKMRQHGENTSAPSVKNRVRHMMEEKGFWYLVIKNMPGDYFVKSFQEQMKNPEASTDEEIMCEKFFLMVQHNRFWMQAIAMDYFIEIYDDPAIRACFKEKYGFKREDFWEIMTEKGLASVLIGK